jgi:mono/diheme cytochrome c family protein
VTHAAVRMRRRRPILGAVHPLSPRLTGTPTSSRVPWLVLAGITASAITFVAACGDDNGSSLNLSDEGQRGRSLSNSSGCGGCHGRAGEGGVGPAFVGLYGSEVELEDGTTVIADEAYLEESIRDPGAERVAGSNAVMPDNDRLDDEEIAAIITYIEELNQPATEPTG